MSFLLDKGYIRIFVWYMYILVYMYSEVLNTGYLLHACKYTLFYFFFITVHFVQMTNDLFVSVACRMKYYRSIFYLLYYLQLRYPPSSSAVNRFQKKDKQTDWFFFFFLNCIKNCASSHICYAGTLHCTHIDAFWNLRNLR